jgi:hypothetical protein
LAAFPLGPDPQTAKRRGEKRKEQDEKGKRSDILLGICHGDVALRRITTTTCQNLYAQSLITIIIIEMLRMAAVQSNQAE